MLLVAFATLIVASTLDVPPQDPAKSFDFWVGDWSMTGKSRVAPGKDEFRDTACKNSISKILGGKVVHENFSMPGFKGQSWSVYNANAKVWTQTWVDDSGAYLLFRGGPEGNTVVLNQTNIPESAGFKNRMIFQNISKDAFDWLWQRSSDGGKTWENQWTLAYKRVASKPDGR